MEEVKDNVQNQVAASTQVVQNNGTVEMPKLQTLDYNMLYIVKNDFIKDVSMILGSMPYVDSVKIVKHFDKHGNIMPAAILNEIIRLLGSFPYKYVCDIMKVIETDFQRYFELHKPENKVEDGSVK